MKRFLFIFLMASPCFAQWPGTFYVFELKDKNASNITELTPGYVFMLDASTINGPASIGMCAGDSLWKFYKGDKNLYQSNFVKIIHVQDTMSIEFPPPLTGGEHHYYANLYIGTLKYSKGAYKVKLPDSDKDWEKVTSKEISLCPASYGEVKFHDISKYQK